MAPHVSENLSRIKRSSSQLNQLADEATEQIRALAEFLDELSPGVEVYDKADFYMGREENSAHVTRPADYRLGYGRDDQGRFGLVVAAVVEMTDEEGKRQFDQSNQPELETIWIQRLDQTSRQIRITAMARLPEFIAVLSDELEKSVQTVRENLDRVRSAASELREALQPAKAQRSRFEVPDPGPLRIDRREWDLATNTTGHPCTGYLNRKSAEIIIVYLDPHTDKKEKLAAIKESPDEWLEIPKFSVASGVDRERKKQATMEFCHEFLKKHGLIADLSSW